MQKGATNLLVEQYNTITIGQCPTRRIDVDHRVAEGGVNSADATIITVFRLPRYKGIVVSPVK